MLLTCTNPRCTMSGREADCADDHRYCTACGDLLLSGRVLGSWRLDDELGRGAMGRVFRARHVEGALPASVIKVLAAEHAGPDQIERFLREAAVLASIEHPNLVRVLDAGSDAATGLRWLRMELVPGRTLEQVIAREAPLSAGRVARLGVQMAEALGALHDRGVLHRDFKTANVLVVDGAGGERVKLVDFGIVKVLGDASRTAAGLVGTPQYMSPEQALGGPLDARSDLAALGAVLYEMMCGAPAHAAASIAEALHKVVSEVPPRPSVRTAVNGRPAIAQPRALEDLCMALLAKRPAARPASAAEVAEALRDVEPVKVEVRNDEASFRWAAEVEGGVTLSALRQRALGSDAPRDPEVPLAGRKARYQWIVAATGAHYEDNGVRVRSLRALQPGPGPLRLQLEVAHGPARGRTCRR